MALRKEVKQPDGIITDYHRIMFIEQWVNHHISIAVLSYVSGSARHTEETPYKVSTTYETTYIENMTIGDAYAFLKTLPEFAGAEDV